MGLPVSRPARDEAIGILTTKLAHSGNFTYPDASPAFILFVLFYQLNCPCGLRE